ncbi:hypothetical protein B0H21DRAFT_768003 [Amylocystis lapponica]|nr:hypothetical protein B0H21DRAFT_768003 [Amylocystis lapponica]
MDSNIFLPFNSNLSFAGGVSGFSPRMPAAQASNTSGGGRGGGEGEGGPGGNVASYDARYYPLPHFIHPPRQLCGVSALPPETVTLLRAVFENVLPPYMVPRNVWLDLRQFCDHAITRHDNLDAGFSSTLSISNPLPGSDIQASAHRSAYPSSSSSQHASPHNVSPLIDYSTPFAHSSLSPLANSTPEPAPDIDSTSTMRCQWDGCNVVLANTNNAAILAHLEQSHFVNLEEPYDRTDRKRRMRCGWNGCRERRLLYLHSMPRHIATQHLGTLSATCPQCGQVFTRSDARNRHIANVCGREDAQQAQAGTT